MKAWTKAMFFGLAALMALSGLTACGALGGSATQAATDSPQLAPVLPDSRNVIAEGNLVPRSWVLMDSRAGGEVVEVLAKEGDVVEAGAVLLRFGDQETRQAALAAAQYEVAAANKALDDLNKTAALATAQANTALNAAKKAFIDAQQVYDDLDSKQYTTDLDNARKDVNTLAQDLEDAQKEFDKYKDLDPANADRKRTKDLLDDAQKKYDDAMRKRDLLINQMDENQTAVASAQAALADAQRVADARQNGPDPDDLTLLNARLKNAEAQVTAAEKAISDLEVRAPFKATVVDMKVMQGEIALPNQPLVMLADLSAWTIETNDLTEIEVVQISAGQSAVIVPDAMPDVSLPATVEQIALDSGKKGGDVTYTVTLALDDSNAALRWGMTVEVRFSAK